MSSLSQISCPRCKTLHTWKNDNLFRPFCSERCKLIDFGHWATESYAIPDDKIEGLTIEDVMEEHDH